YTIGNEAYLYFYPLVLMDMTRQIMSNVPAGEKAGAGPMNAFHHLREFPSPEFRDVVRPNFDTLYSIAWLDLTQEPMVISVPDTEGRYYLLPLLDMWTNVFAVPGKRTSGTKAANFVIASTEWKGKIPSTFERIDAPTPYAWIIGRTQTNGVEDYANVHKIQDGFKLTPLSQWGQEPVETPFTPNPNIDLKTPTVTQVDTMSVSQFFRYASELMKINTPQITDWSMLKRLKQIGLVPGTEFDFDKQPRTVQNALVRVVSDSQKKMQATLKNLAPIINGWQMNTSTMGVYGNDYLKRAIIAHIGLGANQPEDAIYPICLTDAENNVLEGNKQYMIHFDQKDLPPVEAFWSLTMYDAAGFPIANDLNRYALGDRDKLQYNEDGSLDVYIQSTSPGKEKESNWLPSSAEGEISLTMRLYAPKETVFDGTWQPQKVLVVQ
ncbi:MAG: DUF1254 domain-containing protein, partial [Chlamydiia bacterium]|nr:DUF1254 domain-containing protein [Chlamydiia bacterium]